MSSDDLTHNLTKSYQEDKATQPTITAVFRLLQDLDRRLNGRLDKLENRLDGIESRLDGLESRLEALESRLARDFAGVDARFAEVSDEIKKGLLQLSDKVCDKIDRSRLHAEADYEDLITR